MKNYNLLIIILALSLVLASCAVETQQEILVEEEIAQEDITESVPTESTTTTQTETTTIVDSSLSREEREILELIEKGKVIDEFQYSFVKDGNSQYDAFFKGNRVKLAFVNDFEITHEHSLTDIYLNLEDQNALGVCKNVRSCTYDKKIYELDFDQYSPKVTPVSLLHEIGNDWKKINSEKISGLQTDVLEFTNAEGIIVNAHITEAQGLVTRWETFSGEGEDKVSTSILSFSRIAKGSIPTEEVTIPSVFE